MGGAGTGNLGVGIDTEAIAIEFESLRDQEAAEKLIEILKAIEPHVYRALRYAEYETVRRLEPLIDSIAGAKRSAYNAAASEYGID